MRPSLSSLALSVLAGAAFLAGSAGLAADKKEGGMALKLDGELTKEDPKDKMLRNSYSKVHPFKMIAGRAYRIDLKSKDFDAFLRLEDPKGKMVAYDDDSGGGLDARIVYKAKEGGEYKIIATSFKPDGTGKYTLTVDEPSPAELLVARARQIAGSPPGERKEILAALKKHFEEKKDKLTMQDAQMAMGVASSLERGDRALAADAYSSFGKLLAQASNAQVANAAKSLQGAARRVNLPGHEMEIMGATVDGKTVDWKAYRGKVVLVDFWATWCGPCIAELPNVKELYEAYHDRGFEVLGISVDADKNALVKFLEKEKLPWTSIHDKKGDKGESLSDHYGIMFIPLPILVDREGRVVSMEARGPELRRLLAKHLGPMKKAGDEKGKEKAS
jgi:thiol-disulfide isomerase/thioredoxin